jgi:hypothetical protein
METETPPSGSTNSILGGLMPAYAAADQRSRPQKFSLCSDIDKVHRGLPALVELWLDQQVRSRRLPVLLHGLEPQISRLDYISHGSLNSMQRGVRRWAPLVLGVFVTLLGVSELLRHRGDLTVGIGLTVCGILVGGGSLLVGSWLSGRPKRQSAWILSQPK